MGEAAEGNPVYARKATRALCVDNVSTPIAVLTYTENPRKWISSLAHFDQRSKVTGSLLQLHKWGEGQVFVQM